MPLKLIAITLTLSGTIIMMAALHPALQICRAQNSARQRRSWWLLLAMMLLFVMAYIIFSTAIISREVSIIDLVVSALLLGGSCFVILILKMSLLSMKEIRRVAALERHNSLHDELTSLPNRALLYESIQQAISRSRRNHMPMMLLIMDLNQFKEINDTLGHQFGDQLLQALVPRFQEATREMDILARLGGDEFAIVLPETGL